MADDEAMRCVLLEGIVGSTAYGLAGPVLAEAKERFAAARTVLPESPDEATVELWLLRVRAENLDGD